MLYVRIYYILKILGSLCSVVHEWRKTLHITGSPTLKTERWYGNENIKAERAEHNLFSNNFCGGGGGGGGSGGGGGGGGGGGDGDSPAATAAADNAIVSRIGNTHQALIIIIIIIIIQFKQDGTFSVYRTGRYCTLSCRIWSSSLSGKFFSLYPVSKGHFLHLPSLEIRPKNRHEPLRSLSLQVGTTESALPIRPIAPGLNHSSVKVRM